MHAPPSSHLLRSPPSSHCRLHWPSASCACAAPLARPTVYTPSTPLSVGVLRVRRAACVTHRLHTVDSTGRRRPARAPRLLADAGILATSCMQPHKTPQSTPCPFASLTHGIVVQMPSKSFSDARKNRRLQNLSHRSCTLSGCCPPTPPQSSVFPAGRVHRPGRPLTLHSPHTVDSNGRRRPALATAPCTSTIDLVGTAFVSTFVVRPARTPSSLRSRTRARLKRRS